MGEFETGGEFKPKIIERPKPIYMDDEEPSPALVLKLIENHRRGSLDRFKRLQAYYEGYNDILTRTKTDSTKPNNRLVSGYPSYIVDIMQGYFVGKPITYTSEDKQLIEDIQDIYNYNDEQDENSELAKMAGIKGKAYEVIYIDEDVNIRFNEIDADNVILVFDTKINPEPNFAIVVNWGSRLDEVTSTPLTATVYTRDRIQQYIQGENGLILQEETDHYFGQVPIIEYLNNDEAIGDFERVISLIDAYDKANSDTANDFEEFTDAFLYLVNLFGTTDADIEQLKKDKVLLLDEDGQAGWLTKNINDTAIENYKDRLNGDIMRFAKVPDVSDINFSGNISGEAMKYKLLALDQVIATKQRKFKRALQKRIELICIYMAIKGKQYDYREVDINFTYNKPENEKEAVEMAIQMLGITSLSTALSRVPGVDDVELELAKIETEKNSYLDLDSLLPEEDPEKEGQEGGQDEED